MWFFSLMLIYLLPSCCFMLEDIVHRLITIQIELYMSFFQDLGVFRSQQP